MDLNERLCSIDNRINDLQKDISDDIKDMSLIIGRLEGKIDNIKPAKAWDINTIKMLVAAVVAALGSLGFRGLGD